MKPADEHSHPWRFYLGSYKDAVLPLSLCVLAFGAQAFLQLWLVSLVRIFFDRVIPSKNVPGLLLTSLGLVLIQTSIGALVLLTRGLILRLTKLRVQRLRENLLEKIFRLPAAYFIDRDIAKTHAILVQDSERVDVMSNAVIALVTPAALSSIVLVGALVYLNLRLILFIILPVPILWIISRHVLAKVRFHMILFHNAFESFSQGFFFVLRSMDLTRIQTAESVERKRQIEKFDRLRFTSQDGAWWNAAHGVVQDSLTFLCTMMVLVAGGLLVSQGKMTVGGLLSFYIALSLLRAHLLTISSSLIPLEEGTHSLLKLKEFLDIPENSLYNGKRALDFRGKITLSSVHFGYDGQPLLKNIDVILEPGQTTALVGANGTGKTTVVDLILGFQRPQSGKISADDIPYEELDLNLLRTSMAVVRQFPHIFNGTILENLTYGLISIDEKDLKWACDLTLARDVIDTLPEGFNTQIGEGGLRLSGGQVQRIALARALLRRPKLLILDEPTNHLDASAIKSFLDNLKRMTSPPSCLLISHDLQVENFAGHIFYIDNGTTVRRR